MLVCLCTTTLVYSLAPFICSPSVLLSCRGANCLNLDRCSHVLPRTLHLCS